MKVTRQELYEWLWSTPQTKVAEVLGMSPSWLGKQVREFDIATPPRGYWRMLQTGQPVERIPLRDPADIRTTDIEVDETMRAYLRQAVSKSSSTDEDRGSAPNAPCASGTDGSQCSQLPAQHVEDDELSPWPVDRAGRRRSLSRVAAPTELHSEPAGATRTEAAANVDVETDEVKCPVSNLPFELHLSLSAQFACSRDLMSFLVQLGPWTHSLPYGAQLEIRAKSTPTGESLRI